LKGAMMKWVILGQIGALISHTYKELKRVVISHTLDIWPNNPMAWLHAFCFIKRPYYKCEITYYKYERCVRGGET
jgi:hypothetical protein